MVVIVGVHTVVFGHSRYHVPLMPLLAVYAAAFMTSHRGVAWTALGLDLRSRQLPLSLIGATLSVTALLFIWVRQVAFVDLGRISALMQHVG